MSFATYRAAIVRIAAAELNGDNIETDIATLARAVGVAVHTVRHEITEAQD